MHSTIINRRRQQLSTMRASYGRTGKLECGESNFSAGTCVSLQFNRSKHSSMVNGSHIVWRMPHIKTAEPNSMEPSHSNERASSTRKTSQQFCMCNSLWRTYILLLLADYVQTAEFSWWLASESREHHAKFCSKKCIYRCMCVCVSKRLSLPNESSQLRTYKVIRCIQDGDHCALQVNEPAILFCKMNVVS